MRISCSHGGEDPERATLSFIFGNVAAAADQPTAALLTIDGVWLAPKATRRTFARGASSR